MVDRSGSMEGEKISQARKAVQIFLRSLPEGSFFNIISFGSCFTSLFEKSQEYDDETLKAAEKHVDTFQADMGGTEILNALKNGFLSRRRNISTQV